MKNSVTIAMALLFPIISTASDIPDIANTHKTYAGLGTDLVNKNNLNEVATRITALTSDVNQTIRSINGNFSQTGTALQQNHNTLTQHNIDISAANSRLDRQAQFDQVVGATLEANRQQAVVHGNSIANNTDNLVQAGTAIQQNHDTVAGHSADISTAKSRLDRQAQFDQVVGATLEANRQQAVVHGNSIANNTDNLVQAGTAIQQNHDTIAQHNAEISTANSRLDRQAQFDQVVGATLEANRQQAVVHSNSIANNTDNLVQAGTAIQQNSKRIDYLQEWKEISDSRIQRLESNITNNRTVSSKGIAGVAAMTNIPTPTDGSLSFGIGYGYYDSYDALAIGASKYFESGIALKASVSLTSGKSVAGLGASYSFK